MPEDTALIYSCKRIFFANLILFVFEECYLIQRALFQLLLSSLILSKRIISSLNIFCLKWFITKTLWFSMIFNGSFRVVSTATTADSFLVNYWPIENLVLCDYINGKEMSLSQGVTLVADRKG